MKKLFIDDERFPVGDDWVIVRTSADAIKYVEEFGIPDWINFDHDLGGDDTSRKFINWLMMEMSFKPEMKFPNGFGFDVHSQNPVGKQWIVGTMCRMMEEFGEE